MGTAGSSQGLVDRYRIVRRLDVKGGQSEAIILAIDTSNDCNVLLKVISSSDDAMAAELERRKTLRHPNVAQLMDVFVTSAASVGIRGSSKKSVVVCVQEFVSGGSLSDLIAKQEQPLAMDRVLSLAHDIGAGLKYLHDGSMGHSLLHRDLKPSNICLAEDGTAKLIDFDGVLERAVTLSTRGERSGVGVGTPLYFSPARARNASHFTDDDMWAAGLVLLEAALGRPLMEVLRRIPVNRSGPCPGLWEEVEWAEQLQAAVASVGSPRVQLLLRGLLVWDRQKRWTAEDLLSVLDFMRERQSTELLLHDACWDGCDDVVDLLLVAGADANRRHQGNKNRTALHLACERNNPRLCRSLLAYGASLTVDADGLTPLHVACHCGHFPTAETLFEHGASPSEPTSSGVSPLTLAWDGRNYSIAQLLLSRFGPLEISPGLLHDACRRGDREWLTLLLENGEVNVELEASDGSTPLVTACRAGNRACAAVLIERGASADSGGVALRFACQVGRMDWIATLVRNRADANTRDALGWTALHAMVARGQETLVEKLVSVGAENSPDGGGVRPSDMRPALWARVSSDPPGETAPAWRGDDDPVACGDQLVEFVHQAESLELREADICRYVCQATSQHRANALQLGRVLEEASRRGQFSVCRLCLELGVQPSPEVYALACSSGRAAYLSVLLDRSEETACEMAILLDVAAKQQQYDCVELLLERGAWREGMFTTACTSQDAALVRLMLKCNPSMCLADRAQDGAGPLTTAASEGSLEILRLLLDNVTDGRVLDRQDGNGQTAACIAATNGHSRCLAALLEQGGSVDAPNRDGRTPLMLACEGLQVDCVALLLRMGASIRGSSPDGVLPLEIASRAPSVEILTLLLAENADVNAADAAGWTALHTAVSHGQEEAARTLLAHGAMEQGDVSPSMLRPNLWCRIHRREESEAWSVPDSVGLTRQSLVEQVSHGDLSEARLCERLCTAFDVHGPLLWEEHEEKGQAPRSTTGRCCSILAAAASRSFSWLVRLCLDLGAPVDSMSDRDSRWTSLHIAAAHRNEHMERILIARGASQCEAAAGGLLPSDLRPPEPLECSETLDATLSDLLDTLSHDETIDERRVCQRICAAFDAHGPQVLTQRDHKKRQIGCGPPVRKWSLLTAAAARGCVSLCQLLLELGANVAQDDCKGSLTPLAAACLNGSLPCARLLLLWWGASPVQPTPRDGNMPLHFACMSGAVHCAELLLQMGAPVDATNHDGNTALHVSGERNQVECVELLLNRGADVDGGNDAGATVLWTASQHAECVQTLLDWGASPNLPASDGSTPLHEACAREATECVRHLLLHGAEVDACRSDDGVGALHVLAERGNTALIGELLDHGASVDLTTAGGATALSLACDAGHFATATLLLDRGADVNASDSSGASPLYLCCAKGFTEGVRLLLRRGALVDRTDARGAASPLHIACQGGFEECARLVLDAGAPVDRALESGTALCSACLFKQRACALLLLEYGADASKRGQDGCRPAELARRAFLWYSSDDALAGAVALAESNPAAGIRQLRSLIVSSKAREHL